MSVCDMTKDLYYRGHPYDLIRKWSQKENNICIINNLKGRFLYVV